MNKRKLAFVIVAVCLIYFTINTIITISNTENLIANAAFTKGRILACRGISKRYAASIDYEYFINGDTLLGSKSYEINKYKCEELIGKYFEIAYNNNDLSSSEVLINNNDYNKFHLNYPDSLHWTLKYFPE